MFEFDTASAGPVGKNQKTTADTLAVLASALTAHNASTVLDVGCGDGTLASELYDRGFCVTGVDPSDAALRHARGRIPAADLRCAHAEALPRDLGTFDAAYFVNSLHHVHPDRMQNALLRVLSTVRPSGILLVIEPLAQGSFFRVMRHVEDETRVRAQAGQAIESLISSGALVLRDLRRWNRENRFTGLDDFIAYLARVLPERIESARRNEAALTRAWRDNIRSIDGMAVLVQPMVCWTLAAQQEQRR